MRKNIYGRNKCVGKKYIYVSYFTYVCKTEGKNDISRLISETA